MVGALASEEALARNMTSKHNKPNLRASQPSLPPSRLFVTFWSSPHSPSRTSPRGAHFSICAHCRSFGSSILPPSLCHTAACTVCCLLTSPHLTSRQQLTMAPSALLDRSAPNVVPDSARPLRPSKLPSHVRLLILLVLNLGLQAGFWTAASDYLGNNELGAVSKQTTPDDWVTPVARLTYKVVVVCLGWKLNYDCEQTLMPTMLAIC